jgi:hypothetical protein
MLVDPLLPTPFRKGKGSFIIIAAAAALILATAPTRAQPAPGWKPMTARQLATACHSADAAQHATCVGYISGIYDLQFAPTPPRGVYPPQDLTPDLLTEVVVAYLDTHEDGPAPAAIGQAIVRFFPCSEQHK